MDAGYDVWLGNLRGNKYSRRHLTLDPVANAREFFEFDIGHHERVDLVSIIDYIKRETKSDKIAYVGHSMGTTIMFRLAANQQAYVEASISTFVGLGPVIVPTNAQQQSPVVSSAVSIQDYLYELLYYLGFYSLFSPTRLSTFGL